jgi:hypothetical protein
MEIFHSVLEMQKNGFEAGSWVREFPGFSGSRNPGTQAFENPLHNPFFYISKTMEYFHSLVRLVYTKLVRVPGTRLGSPFLGTLNPPGFRVLGNGTGN